MPESPPTETLVIERAYDAPATAVFDAFTHEDVMRRWWHARTGWTTPEASVDLRVGGAVRVVMRNTGRRPAQQGWNHCFDNLERTLAEGRA